MDKYKQKLIHALSDINTDGEVVRWIERNFPELLESEDERIRKALIDGVRQIRCKNGITQEQMVAYLEKQKEEEGYEAIPVESTLEYKLGFKAGKDSEKQKDEAKYAGMVIVSQEEWDTAIADAFKHGMDEGEKQKEQKPAEWNEDWREEDIQTRFAFYTYKDDPSVLYLSNVFVEEASRNHGFGTRILKAAEKAAEAIGAITICLKVKQDSPANAWYRKRGYGYVAFEDGYDWLEKNLEYLKQAKSAEWSEEDERLLTKLMTFVDIECFDRECNGKDLIDWLKSLRPQPMQKRQIKEGDKVSIHCRKDRKKGTVAIFDGKVGEVTHVWDAKRNPWGHIGVRLDNGCNDGFYEDELKVLDESHWKPSEEQMEALKECGECKRCIKELYEQLKKL